MSDDTAAGAPHAAHTVKSVAASVVLATQRPYPNLLLRMADDDPLNVWGLLWGLDGDFAGGEYLVRIRAPLLGEKARSYPTAPPGSFEFYTPNGVFETGGKVCVSIGEFHSQNWIPALGIGGFFMGVVGGMAADAFDAGIRIIPRERRSAEATRAAAAASAAHNAARHRAEYHAFYEVVASAAAAAPAVLAPLLAARLRHARETGRDYADLYGGPPLEPAPPEPAPSEPAPSEPAPSEPAPSNPAPSGPAPSDPAPTGPEPSADPAPPPELAPAAPKQYDDPGDYW